MIRSALFAVLISLVTFWPSEVKACRQHATKACGFSSGHFCCPDYVLPCAGPAIIVVKVSEGTKVYFDDEPAVQTSAIQIYSSPPLPVGRGFIYTVRVEGNGGGGSQTETRTISVRAFCTTEVDFTGPGGPEDDLPIPKEIPKLPEAFFPSEPPV